LTDWKSRPFSGGDFAYRFLDNKRRFSPNGWKRTSKISCFTSYMDRFLKTSTFLRHPIRFKRIFFRIVVAANFQEAFLQIHFRPNDEESLQTVENTSRKNDKLASFQRILKNDEYFERYEAFYGCVLSRIIILLILQLIHDNKFFGWLKGDST